MNPERFVYCLMKWPNKDSQNGHAYKDSYGDNKQNPRNCANSSLTCMDKRPIFGQNGKIGPKVVHSTPSATPHSGGTNTENRRF